MKKVSQLDEYLFDLNGYLIIENALTKKEIKDLAKTWQSLTQNCFQKNFARMFEPSECNDLKSLEKKKRKLYDLGIQIDQGESIRL